MKISRAIELLQKIQEKSPEAELKMHGKEGNNLLFIVSYKGNDKVIVLEDASDNDLGEELSARYQNLDEKCSRSLSKNLVKLNFYEDLILTGFTLEDIQKYIPERYEEAKRYMV